MKRALLPSMIAAIFAVSSGFAYSAERELIFGPIFLLSTQKFDTDFQSRNQNKFASVKQGVVKKNRTKINPDVTLGEKSTSKEDSIVGGKKLFSDNKVISEKDDDRLSPTASQKIVKPILNTDSNQLSSLKVKKVDLNSLKITSPVSKIAVIDGIDVYAQREIILKKLHQGIDVGFFSGNVMHKFTADMDFLPTLNNISAKVGLAVSPAYGFKSDVFRRQILENNYALIFISLPFFDAAVAAGYTPIARAEEKTKAMFIVPSSSSVKDILDLKNKSIGIISESTFAAIGLSALSSAGIAQNVSIVSFPFATDLDNLSEAILKGQHDAILLSGETAEIMIKNSNGKVRGISAGLSQIGYSWWIKKQAFDVNTIDSLTSAIISKNSNLNSIEKNAARRFGDHLNVQGVFSSVSQREMDDALAVLKIAKKDFTALRISDEYDYVLSEKNKLNKGLFNLTKEIVSSEKYARDLIK